MRKFLMSVSEEIYAKLEELSRERGISVQEYLRAIVIPEHLAKFDFTLAGQARKISELFGVKQEEKK